MSWTASSGIIIITTMIIIITIIIIVINVVIGHETHLQHWQQQRQPVGPLRAR